MPDLDLAADPTTRAVALATGLLLLLFGRRLYWLLLGVVGFLLASRLLVDVLAVEPHGVRLALAAIAGLCGALLAIVLKKLGVALAGFAIGAWALAGLLGLDLVTPSPAQLAAVLVAGVVAAVLAVRLFDLALVVLSALAGAGLVLDAAGLEGGLGTLLFVVLAIGGIAVQAGFTARSRRN